MLLGLGLLCVVVPFAGGLEALDAAESDSKTTYYAWL
jgi:hypothetical protein